MQATKWAMAVVVSTALLLSGPVVVADAADPVEWGPWHGSLSISSSEKFQDTPSTVDDVRSGSGSYENLRLGSDVTFSSGEPHPYRADVDITMSATWYGVCGDGSHSKVHTEWSYAGPSENASSAAGGGAGFITGNVLELWDPPGESGTYIFPYLVSFNANQHYAGCPPWGPSDGLQSNSTMGFYAGTSGYTTEPLLDTDPDPAHLVGTTSFSLDHYPDGGSGYSYDDYSYTLVYDLTREPLGTPACRDGIDNDGDGRVDYGDDPGCLSPDDLTELSSVECDNGIDDDRNGKTDYREGAGGDAGCDSLTDETEASGECADVPASDRHYTTMRAPARLDVALSPDPHLGTIALGFAWCMTPDGPRIMTPPDVPSSPSGWWEGTQNWLLLGALQAFAGITVDPPADPTVVHGRISAGVTTSLSAELDGTEVLLSAIPVGKLFKPLKKALRKKAAKLNPLAKRLKAYTKKVERAAAEVKQSRKALASTGSKIAHVRAEIAQLETTLSHTTDPGTRAALKRQLASARSLAKSYEKLERKQRIALESDADHLQMVKQQQHKAARKMNAVLKDVRAALRKADDLEKRLNARIDEMVSHVQPGWAREVVKALVGQLRSEVRGVTSRVRSKINGLKAAALAKALGSRSGSAGILSLLTGTYTDAIKRISAISVPVWDAKLSVSLDPRGTPSVADNSKSRFIFTVHTDPTLSTT